MVLLYFLETIRQAFAAARAMQGLIRLKSEAQPAGRFFTGES